MIRRRGLGRLAFGAAGALFLRRAFAATSKLVPGIKLCVQSPYNPSDEQLLFLQQLGAQYVSTPSDPQARTLEGLLKIKERYAAKGITVWNIGNSGVHNMPEVTLNLPGRDEKIGQFNEHIRNLGKAGIGYHTYAHMGNGIWTSARVPVRGAIAREFDSTSTNARGRTSSGLEFKGPLSHGRVFSELELWENFTYFVRKVAPVAESSGVRIGLHPDDPPVPVLAGVPRILRNFEGYKRAMEIAKSPNIGICFCCGTWLEGGEAITGKDPAAVIRHFGKSKIWKIHFRNVNAPLPHFVETFMDNGYYDMWKIMRALRDIDFDGVVILDHSPVMVGSPHTDTAYGFGYMKALLNRANAEAKKGRPQKGDR